MKRVISLLIAVILMLTLCACGGKEAETEVPEVAEQDISGIYETRIGLRDLIILHMDGEPGSYKADEGEPRIADYLPEEEGFALVTEFREDGTYSRYIDEESYNAALELHLKGFAEYSEAMLLFAYKDKAADYGEVMSSKEELEAFFGESWEEIVISSFGAPSVEHARMTLEPVIGRQVFELMESEGNYKAESGKLWLWDGSSQEADPLVYSIFETDGELLRVTGGNKLSMDEFENMPYELKKISG